MLVLGIVAVLFAAVSFGFALHTMIVSQKMIDSCQNWAQSVSDDCNRNLQVYYGQLYTAMRKDVEDYLSGLDKNDDSEDSAADVVEYIEAADVKIND